MNDLIWIYCTDIEGRDADHCSSCHTDEAGGYSGFAEDYIGTNGAFAHCCGFEVTVQELMEAFQKKINENRTR